MFRCSGFVCFATVFLVASGGASAQTADDAAATPPPRLKPSPILEPPPPKPVPTSTTPSNREAVFLRADRLEGISQQWIEASGNAELRTRTQTVIADWLRYDVDSDEMWGKGNVTLRRGIDWITGPEVKFNRHTDIGFFTTPEFHVGENASRGSATEILFNGPDHYEIKDASYTTCVAGNDDWYLRSADVDLDRSRVVGTAHDATIYFRGAPILYAPWIDFPLSNDRKSGFLTPLFGSSSSRGFEMSQPYYFNLAPNYDTTLTPRLMTRRGLQINDQFRYLFPGIAGEVDVEVLPDRITDTTRYGLSWTHNQTFSFLPGLAGYLNLQKVSDDAYFTDLSDRLAITSQTNLPREGGFAYSQGPFSILARMQAYQTLQDPNNPITPPYFREPQIIALLDPVAWKGLEFSGNAEYVRFRQSPPLINANRVLLYPTASWTQRGNAWFLTARAGLHMTHYDLEDPTATDTHINRVLPIGSVDAGLVFERDAEYFGRNFVQTLEPRAYYVYIPYRQQSQIPVFDTAIDDFNFSQLFTENRYLGSDRIGDANQLTLAATTRLLDPANGEERLRFAVGQRYYFEDQRVTLTEPPRMANTSDVLLTGEVRLSDYWTAAGSYEVNVNHRQTNELDFGIRWQPTPGKVLNATYSYNRQQVDPTGNISQIKQLDFSGQWPIGNWSLIGRWNYSLVDGKTLQGVIGVEYNGGCWALRIVGQRLTTETQTTSSSVFVQFELNGLARLGTNPIDVLKRNVPGYLTGNDPSLQPSGGAAAQYFPGF
jgi:LPS-assembly protein